MRDLSTDLSQLAINTATIKQWSLQQIVEGCYARGIRAITPWRHEIEKVGIVQARSWFKDAGIAVSGYCRGGFFTTSDENDPLATKENRRALEEAAELGAAGMALVVGGLPTGSRDIESARAQVVDGVAALLEHAKALKTPILIEPLHPVLAADRACVNTLRHALDICDQLDPDVSGYLGVAFDVHHLWWDPELHDQTQRAGKARLMAFHVSDWLVPTKDVLAERGMMGDGVIDIPKLRGWVESAGFDGLCEVEIFSANDWWTRDGGEVLDVCIARHRTAV
jgi:sugar phosphate isomerase/epimerase